MHPRLHAAHTHVKASCIGCRHRRRMGSEVWCANMSLAPEQRPHGADNMKGCPHFELGGDDGSGRNGLSRTLEKIALRRSAR